MAQGLELIDQILILVCDGFQVVSYKWLSRKFSIPSNLAKRLLQKFVDQHGNDVEVVYSVSGWTKTVPGCYSVQLVPKAKLQEAKQLLADPVTSHVYSVQPCLPKDPAELWSAEYVQAEELFNEPPDTVNCLRDNRFSAISCVSITRDLKGKKPHIGPSISSKTPSAYVSTSSTEKPPVAQAQVQTSPPAASVPVAANVTVTAAISKPMEVDSKDGLAGKPSNTAGALTGATAKGTTAAPAKKKTTVPAGKGGSLASLWGRASSKPKPISPKVKVGSAGQQPSPSAAGDAEARIRALEAACDASSDDDAEDFACMRRGRLRNGSARKRHVVFEDEVSDAEKEDTVFDCQTVVSLASPELPKEKNDLVAVLGQDDWKGSSVCGNTQVCLQGKENFPFIAKKIEEVPCNVTGKGVYTGSMDAKFKEEVRPKAEVFSKDKCVDFIDSRGAGGQVKEKSNVMPGVVKENITETNTGPKKRKVLKTHIDDRGREVTSVVWEVEGAVSDAVGEQQTKTNNAPAQIQESRPKAPGTAKGANTLHNLPIKGNSKFSGKSVGKDSQGKILSFFKKKN